MRLVEVVVLGVLLAGCTSQSATDVGSSPSNSPDFLFSSPVRVNPAGTGAFEPSIVADAYGNLYLTAHKVNYTEETDLLASWLKWSGDGGQTWQDLPSPNRFHRYLAGIEGDLAIDDAGHLYFVDTYAADNTISRWQTTAKGPVWESSRPIQGTAGADDRPWLAAQGDGAVYYMGNNAGHLPAANAILSGNPGNEGGRIWFYRSLDQGTTWSPGHAFPQSGWCGMRAAHGTPRVAVACTSEFSPASPLQIPEPTNVIHVYTSGDNGATWARDDLKTVEGNSASGYPTVAFDDSGNQYVAWAEDRSDADREPDRIFMATRLAGTEDWRIADITPSGQQLNVQRLWLAAGQEGVVSLVYYGLEELQREPGCDCSWTLQALLATDAHSDAVWTNATPDPGPVASGPESPYDFITNTFGPDGRLYIAYSYRMDDDRGVRVVAQTSGPNLT